MCTLMRAGRVHLGIGNVVGIPPKIATSLVWLKSKRTGCHFGFLIREERMEGDNFTILALLPWTAAALTTQILLRWNPERQSRVCTLDSCSADDADLVTVKSREAVARANLVKLIREISRSFHRAKIYKAISDIAKSRKIYRQVHEVKSLSNLFPEFLNQLLSGVFVWNTLSEAFTHWIEGEAIYSRYVLFQCTKKMRTSGTQ